MGQVVAARKADEAARKEADKRRLLASRAGLAFDEAGLFTCSVRYL